jgi:hypothetical protein
MASIHFSVYSDTSEAGNVPLRIERG